MRDAVVLFPATHEAKLIWMRLGSANSITIFTSGLLSGASTDCLKSAAAPMIDSFAAIHFHDMSILKSLQTQI
jgi:hypothetical protein